MRDIQAQQRVLSTSQSITGIPHFDGCPIVAANKSAETHPRPRMTRPIQCRSRHFGYNKPGLLKFTRYLKRLSSNISLSMASHLFSDRTPCLTQVCRIHSRKAMSSSLLKLSLAAHEKRADEKPCHWHRPTNTQQTICSIRQSITASEACRSSLHRPSSVLLQSVCVLPPTSRHDGPPMHSHQPPMARVGRSFLPNGCMRGSSCASVPTTAVLVKVFWYINRLLFCHIRPPLGHQ